MSKNMPHYVERLRQAPAPERSPVNVLPPEVAFRYDAYMAQVAAEDQERREREAAIVEAADSILEVPRGHRRAWLEAHGLFQRDENSRELTVAPGTASMLIDELDAVEALMVSRTEETREEVAARRDRFAKHGEWRDARSPWGWSVTHRELFGGSAFKENLSSASDGSALWYRKTLTGYEYIAMAFADPRQLEAHLKTWSRLTAVPNLGARRQDILDSLDTCYRAGDVPDALADIRYAYVAKRLERVRLVRAHRDLLEDATVTAALDHEVSVFRQKLAALDEAIEDLRLKLLGVGFDPVYAR